MRCRFGFKAKRGLRGESGAIGVEFAIIIPVFFFLILGGMDLAHMFYIEHLVTTASREGARFGAKYTGNPPVDPTSEQITAFVTATLPPLNDLAVNPPVYTNVPGPPAYRVITVTVTAHKHWWVLGSLFDNPKTVSGTTSMKMEF